MGNYSYYYGEEAEQFNFFRLPKKLIRDRRFKSISSDAKILYGVLLDRMSLSIRCGWVDEENRVYIIYTIKDIMEEFECGEKTAIKFLGELGKAGLVEKKRQGQGKPNLLYVKNFNAAIDVEESPGNAAGDSMEKAGEKQDMKESRNMALKVGVLKKPARIQQGDCTHSRTVQTYRSRTVQMYRPRPVRMYRSRTVQNDRSRTVRTYSQIRLNILRLNIKIYIPIHLSIHLQGIVRRNTDGRGMIEGTDFVWPLISSGKSCLLMPFSLTALKEGLSWMGFCRYWRKPTVRAAGQSG